MQISFAFVDCCSSKVFIFIKLNAISIQMNFIEKQQQSFANILFWKEHLIFCLNKKKLIGIQTKWMSAESDQNFWYNISFCSLIFVYQQFAVFVSNSSRKIHIFSRSTFAAFILKWSTFDLEIEKNYTELKVSLYVCHMSNEYVCATVRKGEKVIAG